MAKGKSNGASASPVASNSALDKQAALDDAEAMGKKEGSGASARVHFYTTLVSWAKDKRVDVSNAEELWDSYDRGAAAAAAMIGGVKHVDNPTDTRKVRVSETRQFLKMGGIPYIDPVEVMDRGMAIIKKARQEGRIKAKATDCMIAVARAQNNDEQNPLDDQTIELVIQPKVGAEKSEADALAAVLKELEKITAKYNESDEVNDAMAYVTKRIDDLGGTSKQKKAQAALLAKQNSLVGHP